LNLVVAHLIAYVGNEPENLACALFSARNALYWAGKPDGWGLGFVQGGDVLLQKRPRVESGEIDLYGLIKDLRADAVIARVGSGQDGNTPAEDADPFRFRSWLFGSVGNFGPSGATRDEFSKVRDRVLESIPAFLRRNIRGHSPSEHVFHLFLAFLHDAGSLDAPSPSPTVVHAALRNSMAFLDRLLAGGGSAATLRLALVATNGRCFVAANGAHPMRYLHVEGISDCPLPHGRVDHDGDGRRIPHENLRAVIVEANRAIDSRGGWRDLPERSALIVAADRVPVVLPL
jgi:glutamine amidotransferase